MAATGHPICERFERHLADLLGIAGESGELSPPERTELLRHEADCPRCAAELRAYRTTVGLLRSLPRHEAPADFLSWVGAGASPRRSRGARFWGARFLGPWALAAAALLVCGVVVFFRESFDRRKSADRFADVQIPLKPFAEEPFFNSNIPLPATGPAVLLTVRLPRARWQAEVNGIDEKLAGLLDMGADLEDSLVLKREFTDLEVSVDAATAEMGNVETGRLQTESAGEAPRAKKRSLASRVGKDERATEATKTDPIAREVVLTVLPDQLPGLQARLAAWARARDGRLVEEAHQGEAAAAKHRVQSYGVDSGADLPRLLTESAVPTVDTFSAGATRDDKADAASARGQAKTCDNGRAAVLCRLAERKLSEEVLYSSEDGEAPASKSRAPAERTVEVRVRILVVPD